MGVLNPYLNFAGNCEEAFDFYQSVFGGEFQTKDRFADMPPQDGIEISDEEKNLIMHVSLPIGENSVLMGSDTGGEWAPDFKMGNNITISIDADSKSHADQLFNGLSEGGQVTMPLGDTFWGSYFGMCVDRFGVPWMISFGDAHED